MFKKIKAFFKGLFWEKVELVLQIEGLQALLQPKEEKRFKKPSVREHLLLLQEEIAKVESQFRVSSDGEIGDPEQLILLIRQMPGLVEESIKVHEMRSDLFEKNFKAKIAEYMEQLCPLLSSLCQKVQQCNREEYVRIRRNIGNFMTKYGDWGPCMGTTYELQLLFESNKPISLRNEGSHLGMTTSASGLVTSFRAAIQMFNEGNPICFLKSSSKT
jgi:hypothetical protein